MKRILALICTLGLTSPVLAQDACEAAVACEDDPCPEGFDLCGVCNGDNACLADDDGGDVCLDIDVCGVCDGDGTSCEDCLGVPGGDAQVDSCGVCGGDDACVDGAPVVTAVLSDSTPSGVTSYSIVIRLDCKPLDAGGARTWLSCANMLPDDFPAENTHWTVTGGSATVDDSSLSDVEVFVDISVDPAPVEGPNRVALDTPAALVLDKLPRPEGLPGNQSIRGTIELDTASGDILFEGIVTGR